MWRLGRAAFAVALSLALTLAFAPAYAQEGAETPASGPVERVDEAMAHLSSYLGKAVSREQQVHRWEALIWPDVSLGCPIPNRIYDTTPTPGYRIFIAVDGVEYEYHTDLEGAQMVLCIDGSPEPGSIGTNYWRLAPDIEADATVRVSSWGIDEDGAQAVLDAIERFEALFPNIAVVYEPVEDEDYTEAMKRLMAAGRAPDVFYIDAGLMSVFSPYGLLAPLDAYLATVGIAREDYVPALIEMFTYEAKTFALPVDLDSLGLVYLPHLFDEAGLDYPTADWTWADMENAARVISERTGIYGVCTPPDARRWLAALYQAGGAVTDDLYLEALFNSPEAAEALAFWYGMYADGYGTLPALINVAHCREALGRELVTMAWEGVGAVDFMAEQYPSVAYAIAPLPAGPAGDANLAFADGVAVNAATPNPVASALLAIYLAGPENQAALLHEQGVLPTLRALLDDSWFDDHPNEAVIVAGAATGRPYYFGHAFFFGLEHRDVLAWITDALNAVFRGERSIQEALDNAVTALN
ncbi:MAG: extracellular solute-binding protein [Deltaproteobacteria bacterium]|nr:extracellular solute-binding protein [Deltaproteobacteria bacterium]